MPVLQCDKSVSQLQAVSFLCIRHPLTAHSPSHCAPAMLTPAELCLLDCLLQDGDTVIIGDAEFDWSNEKSQGKMYEAWQDDLKSRGANRVGSAKWPQPNLKGQHGE